MRLIEAMMEENRRSMAEKRKPRVRIEDYQDELPLIALTCIDPRLNQMFPGALGLPENNFIWLRNAGNIIFGPMSTMMRSLALACAVKWGKEIAIIGHTDCQVRHTPVPQLLDRFKAIGISREQLPEDLIEFFGIFTSEEENVLKSAEYVRNSPLIGAQIPVHGLMVDTHTGALEWLVNGYDRLKEKNQQELAFSKL